MGACVLRQTTSAAPGRKWDKHYDLTLHLSGQSQAFGAPDRAGIVQGRVRRACAVSSRIRPRMCRCPS